MKKSISAVALTVGILAIAAPAQAADPDPGTDVLFGASPNEAGVPLEFVG